MYVTSPILETIGLHRKYLFGKFLATYWQLNFQLEIIGNLIVFEQAKVSKANHVPTLAV